MDFEFEIQRTKPDYVVYRPKSDDGSTFDTGNEHFLVFDGPDGSLMVVWTQSTFEGRPDQRIVFARSDDEGVTWTPPRVIAGAVPPQDGPMCSWGFPLVSKSGRIYAVYGRHIGVNDIFGHTTGLMGAVYSDDAGVTWSGEAIIPMQRSKWDHPDASIPSSWIVWQRPRRLSDGKHLAGFTRWVSAAVRHEPPVNDWTAAESVVEFMRFENIDDDPEPENIEIRWSASDDDALKAGFPGHPELSVIQEPSTVTLPDGRLFTVMRSPRGNPFWSQSSDGGATWSDAAIMHETDHGPALLHPCSPCPIYPLDNNRYLFMHHNHDGNFEQWGVYDTQEHRRPIYVRVGEFRPDAAQPVWFSEPKLLMDNGGKRLGYGKGRPDMAMYASFTNRNGVWVLWYPDRKFFLLGKRITDEWLDGLTVASE
jgi:hypothetical protein